MAFGALRATHKARLRAPQDISVIGFDDHDLAEAVDLTTVAQPIRTWSAGEPGARPTGALRGPAARTSPRRRRLALRPVGAQPPDWGRSPLTATDPVTHDDIRTPSALTVSGTHRIVCYGEAFMIGYGRCDTRIGVTARGR